LHLDSNSSQYIISPPQIFELIRRLTCSWVSSSTIKERVCLGSGEGTLREGGSYDAEVRGKGAVPIFEALDCLYFVRVNVCNLYSVNEDLGAFCKHCSDRYKFSKSFLARDKGFAVVFGRGLYYKVTAWESFNSCCR